MGPLSVKTSNTRSKIYKKKKKNPVTTCMSLLDVKVAKHGTSLCKDF